MNRPETISAPRMARLARRATWFAGTAGAMFASAALAQAPMVILEGVLESSTSLVDLPAQASGTFNASECSDCGSYRVKFEPSTRYYIGDERVSYARFRQLATQGNTRLYVYYKPGTQALTRLRINPANPTK